MRCIITGTTASTRALVLGARPAGCPPDRSDRRSTRVEAVGRPRMKWVKPQEWKSGAAIITVCAARIGIFESSAASAPSPSGWLRCAPFGRAGRARGEDDVAAVLLGGVEILAVGGTDQLLDRCHVGGSRLLLPGDEAAQAGGPIREQVLELLVVDQRRGLLALHHVGELGRREGGVQVEGDGAELRAGHRRLDEVAVVAAHDRDAVAQPDALVAQGAGERVRAAVGLGRR